MLECGKKCLKKEKTNQQTLLKTFSFIRTVCKVEKNSLHEHLNIRKSNSIFSGKFQLYFYKNLFDPDEKSKILSHGALNKSTLETIINEIFSTDIDENEHIIKNFKEK